MPGAVKYKFLLVVLLIGFVDCTSNGHFTNEDEYDFDTEKNIGSVEMSSDNFDADYNTGKKIENVVMPSDNFDEDTNMGKNIETVKMPSGNFDDYYTGTNLETEEILSDNFNDLIRNFEAMKAFISLAQDSTNPRAEEARDILLDQSEAFSKSVARLLTDVDEPYSPEKQRRFLGADEIYFENKVRRVFRELDRGYYQFLRSEHAVDVFGEPVEVLEEIVESREMFTRDDPYEVVYTAAVLELESYRNWTAEGSELIFKENVKRIRYFAERAKIFSADILVLPEYGLEGLDAGTRNDTVFQALAVPVPHPTQKVTPCNEPVTDDVYDPVRELSCMAKDLRMYLVVNLAEKAFLPSHEAIYYNTQVVFDRKGLVIARYRKRHLYCENKFTPSPDDDSAALFTTDFGVTFSLQICFDILFNAPGISNIDANVTTDIAMSTAWIDNAPFNLAPNVQNSWSRSLGVNLLVANYHWPEKGKMGSGIYRSYSDMSNAYSYETHSGDVLIVAPVKTRLSHEPETYPNTLLSKGRVLKFKKKTDGARYHTVDYTTLLRDLSSEILDTFTTPIAGVEGKYATVCHRELCCSLTYSYNATLDRTYRLMAYDGYYHLSDRLLFFQVCGIVWCRNETVASCSDMRNPMPLLPDSFGPFVLSGNFSSDETFPAAMHRNTSLVDNSLFRFDVKEESYIGTSSYIPNLLSAYITGRKYSLDRIV